MNRRKWKRCEHSRKQIIRAGKAIKRVSFLYGELFCPEILVVNNWRASHAYPMHIIYMHLRRMIEKRKDCIVAERLKRLESIVSKLRDGRCNNLWTMQDLGGCRLIVPTVKEVHHYAECYEKSRKRHKRKDVYDYIANPQPSGYRSLHVVYEYHSDHSSEYNRNMLIEIQFRTRLQHLWATAVETMGLFTKKAIKSGKGSDDENRFFALVSTLFAMREEQAIVPNTSSDIREVVEEIRQLDSQNHFLDLLKGFKVATDYSKRKIPSKEGYCILRLNYSSRTLSILKYETFDEADAEYNKLESQISASDLDIVLVRVASFHLLRKAYPNYFSAIGEFVDLVSEDLNKY